MNNNTYSQNNSWKDAAEKLTYVIGGAILTGAIVYTADKRGLTDMRLKTPEPEPSTFDKLKKPAVSLILELIDQYKDKLDKTALIKSAPKRIPKW